MGMTTAGTIRNAFLQAEDNTFVRIADTSGKTDRRLCRVRQQTPRLHASPLVPDQPRLYPEAPQLDPEVGFGAANQVTDQ